VRASAGRAQYSASTRQPHWSSATTGQGAWRRQAPCPVALGEQDVAVERTGWVTGELVADAHGDRYLLRVIEIALTGYLLQPVQVLDNHASEFGQISITAEARQGIGDPVVEQFAKEASPGPPRWWLGWWVTWRLGEIGWRGWVDAAGGTPWRVVS
jgi:hypothetical protein